MMMMMLARSNVNPENMRFRWLEPLAIRRSLGKSSERPLTAQQTVTIAVLVSAPILALGAVATVMRPNFGTTEMIGVCIIAALLSFTVTWLVPFVNRFLPRTIVVDHRAIRLLPGIGIPFARAIGVRGSRIAPQDIQFTAIASGQVDGINYPTLLVSLRGGGDLVIGVSPSESLLELRHYLWRWDYKMEESPCEVELPEIGGGNRWNTFASHRPAPLSPASPTAAASAASAAARVAVDSV